MAVVILFFTLICFASSKYQLIQTKNHINDVVSNDSMHYDYQADIVPPIITPPQISPPPLTPPPIPGKSFADKE